jgi:hypothetical protein
MMRASSATRAESLWRLAAPPLVWLAHFTLCYGTVVAACGRWTSGPPAGAVPALVSLWTVAALAALGGCLVVGTGGRAVLEPARALDDDTPASRAAFVATTNALLVLAGGLAVLFVAAAIWLVPRCR